MIGCVFLFHVCVVVNFALRWVSIGTRFLPFKLCLVSMTLFGQWDSRTNPKIRWPMAQRPKKQGQRATPLAYFILLKKYYVPRAEDLTTPRIDKLLCFCSIPCTGRFLDPWCESLTENWIHSSTCFYSILWFIVIVIASWKYKFGYSYCCMFGHWCLCLCCWYGHRHPYQKWYCCCHWYCDC